MERQIQLEFRNSPDIGSNAFALPGGVILITGQMIALTLPACDLYWPLNRRKRHMSDKHIRVERGETIFKEGDDGDCMYVIVEGQVQIVRDSGSSPVVLATLGEGAFFGEMAILHRTTRTATAVAVTDVELMTVQGPDLVHLLAKRPELGARMIHTLTRRLEHTTNQVMDEKAKIALLFDHDAESEAGLQSG